MEPQPATTPRRSLRRQSDPETPQTPASAKKPDRRLRFDNPTHPVTPSLSEPRKRKLPSRNPRVSKSLTPQKPKRTHYRKVIYDGGEFEVGDDVYVKRREGAESDDEDPEVEECRICFKAGTLVMIECDDCLGGFHLKCLKPPLRKVPDGDWICGFCERRRRGEEVKMPRPSEGKKLNRTAKEKLLTSDLWAARIERLWKDANEAFWMRCRWYMIPEETEVGRQPHNLRRELYRTNHSSDVEMESVIRHCYVLSPKKFSAASNDGDDVYYCEYEYDVIWHSFKRIVDINEDDEEENVRRAEKDEEWKISSDLGYETDEDSEPEEDETTDFPTDKFSTHKLAANSRRGRVYGLHKIGLKKIPEHVRCCKQTDLEKAKAILLLATLPKSLPCRNKEMDEITSFIKGAICGEQCIGRCLYIHGVPGTGKTMSVLAVMRNLKSEVDAGRMRPYCFAEINSLKLASPENIYKVIYEALSGNRVGWKKALHFLNERFSDENKVKSQPCILLIDELDLLLTRNQSVLYNILDWPTKPHSNLIVIGIANTMDLPEKLLPRISSRMGIQRLCFGPYNYQQLQEIISTRLKGIDSFEDQAIEFASRKVAAMSGDARRALEICKRAAEIADYRLRQSPNSMSSGSSATSKGKCLVGMPDVGAAIQEVFQAPHIQIMKACSRLSKIMLVAMVHELYRSGLAEVTFEKLATTVFSLCSNNREPLPGWDSLLKIGCKLGECRIILCEEGVKHRLQKLQLNFPSDDIAFALKDCPELPWLSKYL